MVERLCNCRVFIRYGCSSLCSILIYIGDVRRLSFLVVEIREGACFSNVIRSLNITCYCIFGWIVELDSERGGCFLEDDCVGNK